MKHSRVWLLLFLCNLFWAGNYVFGKYVITMLSPLWLTFSRWVLALVVLIPLACLMEKPDWKQVGKQWLPLAFLGLTGVIGYNLFLYSALVHTSATNAALVTALNPGVIVLFSFFFLREKITAVQAAGFLLSLLGVLVVLTRGELMQIFAASYNTGDLLTLGAVLVWTLYSIMGRKIKGVKPITATAASTLLAVVMLLPFAIGQEVDFAALDGLAITGLVYIVLFPSIFSFMFWNMAVREVGANKAGISLNLIPVITAVISVVLGEGISGSQVWGGLLVITGVALASGITEMMRERKKAAEEVSQ
jgi:drug/metabolite transporter (DMT)-like permease